MIVQRGIDEPLGSALGYICKLRKRDRKKIERERHRLPVEVAAGDDVALFRKDQRVVGDRVDLAADRLLDVVDRVPACTVNLRDAADGIRILHLAEDDFAGELAIL